MTNGYKYTYIKYYYRQHFPYYQQTDQRWKNSVRHTLTVSHPFQKADKAKRRGGHFWVINKEHQNVQKSLVRICQILSLLPMHLEIFYAGRLKKYFEDYFAIKEKSQYRPGYENSYCSRFCITMS
jgi:hypothetical protein